MCRRARYANHTKSSPTIHVEPSSSFPGDAALVREERFPGTRRRKAVGEVGIREERARGPPQLLQLLEGLLPCAIRRPKRISAELIEVVRLCYMDRKTRTRRGSGLFSRPPWFEPPPHAPHSGFLNQFSADRNSLGPRRGKKQEGLTTTITNSSCEIRTTHTGVYILRRIHRPSPAHGVDYTRPTLPPSLTGEARDGPLRLSRGPPSGISPRGSSETRPGWSSRVDPAPLPRALAAERRSLRRRARRAASDSRHPSPVCHAGVRHAKGLARAGSCSNSIQTASVHIHAAAARFAIFTIACIAGEWQEETRTETRTDTRTEEPTTYPNGPRTHGWGGSNIRRRARRERIYTSPEHVVEHRPARADQLLAADIVLLAADVIDEGFHLAQPACARASRKSQVHAPTSQVNSTSNEKESSSISDNTKQHFRSGTTGAPLPRRQRFGACRDDENNIYLAR